MKRELLIFFTLSFSGCTNISEKQILGMWNALYLKTDSTTYFKEVEPVSIYFKPDKQYSFSGTIGFQDHGIFELKDSFIFLKSSHSEIDPIWIKIKEISNDTLVLEMKGEQLITFYK